MTFKNLFKFQFMMCAVVLLLTCATVQAQVSGTPGKIAKFKSPSSVGDSVITEDKFGKVGVGTDLPTSKFTVAGMIESLSGGIKFPDGTTQTAAGIAANQVVSSLNGLKGHLTLAAGQNITVTPNGNTLTIASTMQDPALSAFQAQVGGSFPPWFR